MPIIYHTSHTDNHTLNNSWHTYLFESEVKLVRILYVSNLQAALLSNVYIKLKLVQEFLSYIFFLLEVLKTRGFQNMLFSHWPTENLLISYWLKNSRFSKLKIFQTQKTLPKNGVEFRQKSIGAIRCSVATSYDDMRCCAMSVHFHQSEVRGGWVYNPILVIIFTKPINYSR